MLLAEEAIKPVVETFLSGNGNIGNVKRNIPFLMGEVLYSDIYIPNMERNILHDKEDIPIPIENLPFDDENILNVAGKVLFCMENVPIAERSVPFMASSQDFIPKNDAEFLAWSTNFFAVLNANLAALGLVAADVTPSSTAQTNYSTTFTDQVAKQAAADAAVATKKTRRTAYEPLLRSLVRRIQAHPGMTDGLRAQLGVTVPTRTRTRRGVGS